MIITLNKLISKRIMLNHQSISHKVQTINRNKEYHYQISNRLNLKVVIFLNNIWIFNPLNKFNIRETKCKIWLLILLEIISKILSLFITSHQYNIMQLVLYNNLIIKKTYLNISKSHTIQRKWKLLILK